MSIEGIEKDPIEEFMRYKVLICISMVYMCIMLFNALLTNRYIGNDVNFVLGGSYTSPFFFIIGNVVAEVYGEKISKQLVLWVFLGELLFIVLCQVILAMPEPSFFVNGWAYESIFGTPLLRIYLSSFLAYLLAFFINVHLVSRWKILVQGRFFWLRNLGATTISEAIYSAVAIFFMQMGALSFTQIIWLVFISYAIKVSYSLALSGPANLLTNYLKKITQLDVYDFDKEYTPFKYSK